jgi:hypothetical protein
LVIDFNFASFAGARIHVVSTMADTNRRAASRLLISHDVSATETHEKLHPERSLACSEIQDNDALAVRDDLSPRNAPTSRHRPAKRTTG